LPAATAIELRIRDIGQLFHSLDPLPYRERDLDQAVEEYVVGWARELDGRSPPRIVIHLPEAEARRAEAAEVGAAIRNYFRYRAEIARLDLRELFRTGRAALAVGLAVLAACLLAGGLLNPLRGGYIASFVNESLIILAWVANWRPMQIFLYDWRPLQRRRRLLQRLGQAEVALAPHS